MTQTPIESSEVVLFETLSAQSGHQIGLATLNMPRTLNGLSLDMVRLLDRQFKIWRDDANIAAVVMRGAGDKAFCAGGDLHGIYKSMVANAGRPGHENTFACDFFAEEYALDYLIHTFPKPIMCWGDGIVMGGGMGLMMGASHRIVTEHSRLAMPEITVGLFPDVGGSWLLSRAPGRTGLFLGLTGLTIHAGDAMFCGMADYVVKRDDWAALLKALEKTDWSDPNDSKSSVSASKGATPTGLVLEESVSSETVSNHAFQLMTDAILKCQTEMPLLGPVRQYFDDINRVCAGFDLERIVQAIQTLANHPEEAFHRAVKNLQGGCPGTARLAWLLYHRAPQLSLVEIFKLEYGVAVECAASGSFQEGIRALLIDKDRNPKWPTATLAETEGDWSKPYFDFKTTDPRHPLAKLGLKSHNS
jgi:enoyl-CoA hydratase/carnithine racemase